jgi:hypothetical protein
MATFKYSKVEKAERDSEELLTNDPIPLWSTRKWPFQLCRCWPIFVHISLAAIYSAAFFYYITQYKPSDQTCAKQLSSYCIFICIPEYHLKLTVSSTSSRDSRRLHGKLLHRYFRRSIKISRPAKPRARLSMGQRNQDSELLSVLRRDTQKNQQRG